jgi:hypothetical protein
MPLGLIYTTLNAFSMLIPIMQNNDWTYSMEFRHHFLKLF